MKKSELNGNIYLSEGNRKLERNENEYFLIWSLPSVKTCPYRTNLCENACYAKKAERVYKTVLPCREKNLLESRKDSFIKDMISTIHYYINKPKNKDKACYFRIHESGDFYTEEYMLKWFEIANAFPQIKFLAYTKSLIWYVNNREKCPSNLLVRFSVWKDTKQNYIDVANSFNIPIYTAFPKEELTDKVNFGGYTKCDCYCKKCKKCYGNNYKSIAVAIH